jgi:hypothetical protein
MLRAGKDLIDEEMYIIALVDARGRILPWCRKLTQWKNHHCGWDFYYPPYEYLDDSGIPKGYNVDLMREIARLLDFQLEFRLAKWAKVREWLIEGEIDLIEGMAYSVQRVGSKSIFGSS